MLNLPHFYNKSIRNVVVVFGTLFNEIQVLRTTGEGDSETQRFTVPLSYSSKEKWLARLRQGTQLEGEETVTQMSLPRMGFELTNVIYDPQRKHITTTTRKVCDPNDPNVMLSTFVPVPYDLELSLYIIVDKQDDGLQIVEQILPFFSPEFTVSIKSIEGLYPSVDVPFILNSTTIEDNFEGDMTERRFIIWTLTFTAKAQIFGLVNEGGFIRKVIANLREFDGSLDARICVEPDPLDAAPGDPFEPMVDITECGGGGC